MSRAIRPDERPQPPVQPPATARQDAPSVIEVRGLRVTRGDVTILEGIDLDVPDGQFLGILGPNGGGKSTLLRVLLGLEPFDEGTIRVLGLQPGASREIGYVPQSPTFDLRFPARVREVVTLGLPRGADGREGRRRCRRVLEDLGLASMEEKPAGVLSGGERQKMFLARALLRDPRILLLDEPTLGVDAQAMDAFMHLLVQLRRERPLTVLMVSHDFGVVSTHADAVICVSRTIHFRGSPAELDEGRLAESFGVHSLFLDHRH